MKTCFTCKVEKPLSAFSLHKGRKDGVQTYCKVCRAATDKAWYSAPTNKKIQRARINALKVKLKQWVYDYLKSHPCSCGEARPACLEFHHIDPATKVFNVSMGFATGSINKIKAEVAKCVVVCANCHKLQTAKQFNWYKDLVK